MATRRRETKPEHRSFGTIIESRGRFKVRYTGPDRKLHRAGLTFTTRERAQGWLAGELKLIEFGEWTPPAERRRQAEAASTTFDKFVREWIDHRLVKESPVSVEGATARATPKDITLLTVAQVQSLADAMPPRHRLLVLLAAWCGLRFGELTALRRRDLDLVEGTVTVEQAAVTVAGRRLITTPKSTAGRRTVYLPPHLTEDARRHLAAFTPTDADALVFPGNDGLPLTPGQVYGHAPRFNTRTGRQLHPGNGFYRARFEIGRPDFRFHDLRHFAATMAAISGATTKELMQFAGHSDIHVAMRYQEAVNDRKKDLARRMTALATVVAPPRLT